ncbi:RICIN domain-containing protein [Novosphingobium sp. Chol11]|uniref:RICIN domain-containing protein n=1 Tax=Novosphingobium sp. Chol11 TaxID=1385763 RepID=UPI0025EAA3A9|nr:RICIN domain-containing protein [Novosphingobium sp. Chol11]
MMATSANAQAIVTASGSPTIASYHSRGMCLDVRADDKAVLLWTCHGGANQAFRFASGNYGLISLGNRQCLTGGRSRGAGLTVQTCNNADQAQKWGFQSDGSLRNEMSLCADIEGGSRAAGTRIVSWDCNVGSTNQTWYPAVVTRAVTAGVQTMSAMSVGMQRGPVLGLIGSAGFSGNNMVAAGGGNMVAAGGGNLVAAGGGNLVVGGAGRLIAAGGGNMVAAGGLNVVPTNGGGLLPRNWSFFNNRSVGQLVGNDGASIRQ